jgi:FHA domain
MELHAALRLAPGGGHVARRGDALLYLPERDERLLDAFMSSPEGGELQALASATVAAGFDVTPFVGVGWTPTVRVMAFGATAVETDQPSLPMLSGAGSRTWVEHSLSVESAARIESGADDATVDEATDLTAGVALAGGFRLELAVAVDRGPAVAAAPAPPERSTYATESVPRPPPPVEAVPPEAEGQSADADAAAVAPPAPPVSTDDPAAALAAIQAAATGVDGRPVYDHGSTVEASPPAPSAPSAADDDEGQLDEFPDAETTLPPPAPGELLGHVIGAGGASTADDGRGALVDAKLCSNGHANPPVVASCAVCGQLLTPGTATVVHVPRPSLGHLELDDGTIVELDHELLIGRNPDRDSHPERAELRRVKVLGDKVSRSHLEIRYQGWDVLGADCGSTNGTFVVPHPGGQVTALEPGRAQLLEPGATVYFGSRSFTVVGRESG